MTIRSVLSHVVRGPTASPLWVNGGAGSTLLEGLVSWWGLEEASGTRIDSVTATGNDLTDNNTVGQGVGIIGKAADFVAANSEFLDRAAGHGLQGGARDFTFQYWVNVASWAGGLTMAAVATTQTATDTDWIMQPNGSGRQDFSVGVGASFKTLSSSAGNLSTGTWHNVIGWYDDAIDTLHLSVNNGTVDTLTPIGTPNTTGGKFRMGVWVITNLMNGLLDECAFWSRVLTAAERTKLFNAGAGIGFPG